MTEPLIQLRVALAERHAMEWELGVRKVGNEFVRDGSSRIFGPEG